MAAALVAACGSGADPAPAGGAFLYAGGGTTIDAFRVDPTTGALTFVGEAAAGDDAFVFDLDARRRRVYVQTQLGIPVVIRAFDIQSDGALRMSGDRPLPHPMVEGVTQIQVHPTAPWLLASATGGATGLEDQLMPVGGDGRLGQHHTISTEFYGFTFEPTGRYFYGFDGVAISQFGFDATAGAIAPLDPPQAAGTDGHQILALARHPGGRWVYSVEEGALGLLDLDAASGRLAARAWAQNPLPTEPVFWASMAIHRSGGFLYAVGYVPDTLIGLIDLFAIDPASGALRFVKRERGGTTHQFLLGSLQAPLLLGDLLFVGGQATAQRFAGAPVLVGYRIDPADGTLTPVGDPTPLRPATAAVNFIFWSSGP
jgi:6-phosphogluconolactonase (cycloisomerase 2 family)